MTTSVLKTAISKMVVNWCLVILFVELPKSWKYIETNIMFEVDSQDFILLLAATSSLCIFQRFIPSKSYILLSILSPTAKRMNRMAQLLLYGVSWQQTPISICEGDFSICKLHFIQQISYIWHEHWFLFRLICFFFFFLSIFDNQDILIWFFYPNVLMSFVIYLYISHS